jgi:uncharacterized protein (DUF433 family)
LGDESRIDLDMATAPKLVYAHITRDPEVRGGIPCIDGTRLAVVDIALLHMRGYQPEEMLDYYMRPLTLAQVHSALAYYFDNREEIEGYFEEARETAERVEAARTAYLNQRPGV